MPVVCNAASTVGPCSPVANRGEAAPVRAIDARRALGRLGEDLAVGHFERLGFRVLDRNVRTRAGEVDLIVCDRRTLVFVEVKTGRGSAHGRRACPDCEPLAGLRARQRRRVRGLAVAWLSGTDRARPTAQEIRFDAVGVTVDARGRLLRLDHIEAAW